MICFGTHLPCELPKSVAMNSCAGEAETEQEEQSEDAGMPGDLPGHTPKETQRSFTDVGFVPVFAVALVLFGGCLSIALGRGSFQRLVALPNRQGILCGTEGQGPYLFFCRTLQGDDVDLSRPTCLEECPADDKVDVRGCEAMGASLQSYPSSPLAGMLCMPSPAHMVQDVRVLFSSNAYFKTLFDLLELSFDWEQPMLAAIVASCLSHAYLLCLSESAEAVLYFGLVFLVVAPMMTGLLFVYMSVSPDVVAPRSFAEMISTGSTHADWAVGWSFLVLALLATCLAAVRARSIDAALPSLEEAADCFRELPCMGLEPWISSAVKVALLIPGFFGFLMLNVSGEMVEPVDFSQSSAIYRSDVRIVLSLVYYVVIYVWVLELQHALSQFATMFATQLWFFRRSRGDAPATPARSACDMLLGYRVGLFYHFGSLLFGSLLCTFLRFPQLLASIVVQAAEERKNPVSQFLQRSCQRCVRQAERLQTTVTSLGYCDIAMNSSAYCAGSENAMSIVEENGTGLLADRVAGTISLIGVGLVSLGTALISWLLCSSLSRYNSVTSEHYVADKRAVMLCSAFVGALLSLPFMHLYDTICDAIIYCKALEARRSNSFLRVGCWNFFGP
ncbi:SLC44A1 [Symbiodinium necroappetens]|uniref:Choline transporter-like protein n=1 Tax=Symbiodinium necroappetens TaxID=1628268 RepID=A0A812NL37_9DINO|nr:SLC44A1 [Symbiodinium necroappetens]